MSHPEPSDPPGGGMRNQPTPLATLGTRGSTTDHFRRDHAAPPAIDLDTFSLEVGGAVRHPFRLTRTELEHLPRRELAVVLECAGHRRDEFDPPAEGIQWGIGAIGEARWSGVPLAAVLERAGVLGGTVEIVLEGLDSGPFPGRSGMHRFARSIPLAKALHEDTLLALAMDGEVLPAGHGGPLRAVVPGWYATDSVKWLHRIVASTHPFEGVYQLHDYRIIDADTPAPGRRLSELPVHALMTDPADGARLPAGIVILRGAAWGGRGGVAAVEISVDGRPVSGADIERASSPYGRSLWSARWHARPGMHTVTVRATDGAGGSQPDGLRWNLGGYGNNAVRRSTVIVS